MLERLKLYMVYWSARLAQLVERTAFNRMVVGSSPTVGTFCWGSSVGRARFVKSVMAFLRILFAINDVVVGSSPTPSILLG